MRIRLLPAVTFVLLCLPQATWATTCSGGSGTIGANCTDLSVSSNNETITINQGITVSSSNTNVAISNATSGFTLTNNGTASGSSFGVYNTGTIATLTNTATGTINGGSFYGVYGGIINTVNNAGTITAGDYGIIANSGTINTINNSGTLSGHYGIAITNGTIQTITNTGTITGDYSDILDQPGQTLVTLNNSQGGGTPLTYLRQLPHNYNIIINSPTAYGKLSVTQVSGTTTFGIYNTSTVATGTYTGVLSGVGPSNLNNTSGTFSTYNWALNEEGTSNIWDLVFTPMLPTATELQNSVQTLSSNQRAMLVNGRATTNAVLGMTRPMENANYTYAGGMFGSAVGYVGGQLSGDALSLMGGVAYGAQDYSNIHQSAATTIALAGRYIFRDAFDNDTLRPFAEIGGWVTPGTHLTLTRPYLDNGISYTGTGSTRSTNWGEYGRAGLIMNADKHNQFTGYVEFGNQSMQLNGYTEASTTDNFAPVTVNGGTLSMDVMRLGGSATHKLDNIEWGDTGIIIPVSLTVAASVAHSVDVHSGLRISVSNGNSATAAGESDTWAEFGGRVEGQITDDLALDLDVNGTGGSSTSGASVHGGIGLTYKF